MHYRHVSLALGLLCATLVSAQQCAVVKDPKPQHLHCGGKFTPHRPRTAAKLTRQRDVHACAQSCLNNAACKSITYNDEDGMCQTYRRSGKVMGLDASTDGTQFYNIGCFEENFPPTQFGLIVSGGSDYDGKYAYAQQSSDRPLELSTIATQSYALTLQGGVLTFGDGTTVYSSDNSENGHAPDQLYAPRADDSANGVQPRCSIDSCTNKLTCSVGVTNTSFFYCQAPTVPVITRRVSVSNPLVTGIYASTMSPDLANCMEIEFTAFRNATMT